jgi:hypothetical protein
MGRDRMMVLHKARLTSLPGVAISERQARIEMARRGAPRGRRVLDLHFVGFHGCIKCSRRCAVPWL